MIIIPDLPNKSQSCELRRPSLSHQLPGIGLTRYRGYNILPEILRTPPASLRSPITILYAVPKTTSIRPNLPDQGPVTPIPSPIGFYGMSVPRAALGESRESDYTTGRA